MKSILVPIGGSQTDEPLLETALAAARPFAGHLQFLHIHVGAGQAAVNMPHTGFAMGPALATALKEFDDTAKTRSAVALQHFRDFCSRASIEIRDEPSAKAGITASWREEDGQALKRIMLHARHNDLVVVGRAKKANGLPDDFLSQLLLGAGRPVLIASATPPSTLTGTVMVCWKESPESARALTAAMPFLTHAARVVVASVAETGEVAGAARDVAQQLAWNGVHADVRVMSPDDGSVAHLLSTAAHECGADLVVLGAFGRSRMHELLFGSFTQAMIENADRPVLLMH
jgi:nucleotide-binding universal stress UspA family protein